jgi:hypothetical protein
MEVRHVWVEVIREADCDTERDRIDTERSTGFSPPETMMPQDW